VEARRRSLVIPLTLLVLGLGAPRAWGVTTFTPTRFDDPPPGTCDPGDCSLREAIIAANGLAGPDDIVLAAGTYTLSIPGTGENSAADGDLDAGYWARNLTEPVNFTAAIRELVRVGHTAFIEISPHPVLQSSVQQGLIHLGEQGSVLSSTRRDEPERYGMLLSLAVLYASGRTIAARTPLVPTSTTRSGLAQTIGRPRSAAGRSTGSKSATSF